ncbi:MAG: 2-succinyl-5-enolpyruvyl-6-hydroxy-3-cyclohexene-1-carboxylic-acid synthase [Gammaproteobacteria bacterium]|nr:2-succinyl-5-enolpyruvyl-6-hydroxy-3-cyclohexene-1-carboxylic-acid synthase [Gammaproteobacteria bacterium]
MNKQGQINYCWARSLMNGLVSRGLQHVVISPGSRSTPLALACERHPAIRTWIQVDERSAAFFALGLARTERQPVGLVATSGSAPAHWYPAIIEASQSAIPLLLMSADRPAELQDCGANQTIDQVNLFGRHVRQFHQLPLPSSKVDALAQIQQLGQQAAAQSLSPLAGPVHLNIPFAEPLVPDNAHCPGDEISDVVPVPAFAPAPDASQLEQLASVLGGKPGIIVCGPEPYADDFALAVTELACRLGAPILADPLSNLRFGPQAQAHIISRYDAFLRRPGFSQAHCPDWVLRFGAMPVSKALSSYMESCDKGRHYLVDNNGRMRDPLHRIDQPIAADPVALCRQLTARLPQQQDRGWLDKFTQQQQRAAELAQALGSDEASIIRQCIEKLPEHSTLFSSNSMCIRDLDSYSGHNNKNLRIIANRGVSGIDGNLSTLLGVAAANLDKAGITLGLIGDLAFFHDMNGLLMARGLEAIIILFNNSGGAIFQHLPQVELPEFERIWMTPTQLDFSRAAQLYGLGYQRLTRLSEFDTALETALHQSGVRMIELVIDAETSKQQHQRYWQAVSAD